MRAMRGAAQHVLEMFFGAGNDKSINVNFRPKSKIFPVFSLMIREFDAESSSH